MDMEFEEIVAKAKSNFILIEQIVLTANNLGCTLAELEEACCDIENMIH